MRAALHGALTLVTLILVLTGCAGASKDRTEGARDETTPQERGKNRVMGGQLWPT